MRDVETNKMRDVEIITKQSIDTLLRVLLMDVDKEEMRRIEHISNISHISQHIAEECIKTHFKNVNEKVYDHFTHLYLNGCKEAVPILTECCAAIFVMVERCIARIELDLSRRKSSSPLMCDIFSFVLVNTMNISDFVSKVQDALLTGDNPDMMRLNNLKAYFEIIIFN